MIVVIKNIEKLFDWTTDTLQEKCNVLMSNPPYLSLEEWEQAEVEVKEYDPKDCTYLEEWGKADLDNIMCRIPEVLDWGGLFALEFGKGHGDYL